MATKAASKKAVPAPLESHPTYKVPNAVFLTNYAFVDKVPGEGQSVRWRDHMVPFTGRDLRSDLMWAIYGTTSAQRGLITTNAARKPGQTVLTLSLLYKLGDLSVTRQMVGREEIKQSGLLHIDRIRQDLRNELEQGLRKEFPQAAAQWAGKSLKEIILGAPMTLYEIIRMVPEAAMVVGHVESPWETGAPLSVAVFRPDPERFVSAEVRFRPGRKLDMS